MNWTKCYEDSWKDHIVPEAFSHPAKMAYGLLSRILTHAEWQGWLKPQSIILDCFGGISTTGILAAYRGYQVITCELEDKFVTLALENMELHRKKWEKLGCPVPIVLKGDSRRLCELVESADIIVSSPPFMEAQKGGGISAAMRGEGNYKVTTGMPRNCYQPSEQGQTPGQLGNMKAGKVDMVISSPPYAESLQSNDPEFHAKWCKQHGRDVTKPNYKGKIEGYGSTKGNLGNLKAGDVDLILSSPPWEGSGTDGKGEHCLKTNRNRQVIGKKGFAPINKQPTTEIRYGDTEGNIGQEQGPTFWQAAKEILEQCFQILKPGGVAIWVCKDFVRKGKRVPFSDDWLKLCDSVGFKLACRHRAMLVKEETHPGLFGDSITKKTERKSFFRRLAEAKGSPKIDWEDVICVLKDS